jgi:hypothetical protein
MRQNPGHGRKHPKSTDDCSTRFRAGLGVGFRCSPRCAHVSCDPLSGHRICGAVLFGLGIPQSLATAPGECRFHRVTRSAHLAGNKYRRVDRQTGIHHRCARLLPLRAWHDPVFRGEFAAAAAGSRLATVVLAAGIETAPIVFTLWQYYLLKAFCHDCLSRSNAGADTSKLFSSSLQVPTISTIVSEPGRR